MGHYACMREALKTERRYCDIEYQRLEHMRCSQPGWRRDPSKWNKDCLDWSFATAIHNLVGRDVMRWDKNKEHWLYGHIVAVGSSRKDVFYGVYMDDGNPLHGEVLN